MPKRGRPALPPDERRVSLGVRVKPETRDSLRAKAEASGKSRGDLIDEWDAADSRKRALK